VGGKKGRRAGAIQFKAGHKLKEHSMSIIFNVSILISSRFSINGL
jgi:hypothetical protein